MEKETEKLIEILTEELRVHADLLRFARAMNDAIKTSDLSLIGSATERYDALSGQMEDLEERRLEVCRRIAARPDIRRHHLTLRDIIALASDPRKSKLTQLRNSLRSSIMELTGLNTENNILLKESLTAITRSFEVVSVRTTAPSGYRKGGNAGPTTTVRHLINKTA